MGGNGTYGFFSQRLAYPLVDNFAPCGGGDGFDLFSTGTIVACKDGEGTQRFRNPLAAPLALQVRAMESPFEKESRFVKAILSSWADINSDLQAKVQAVLPELGFEPNDQAPLYPDPENAFAVGWPEDLSFEKLADLVKQKTETDASSNEISLMTVWLTGRLPGSEPTTEQS